MFSLSFPRHTQQQHQQQVRLSEHLNHLAHSAKLIKLSSSTRYRICVIGLSNWISSFPPSAAYSRSGASTTGIINSNIFESDFHQDSGGGEITGGSSITGVATDDRQHHNEEMVDSAIARCTEVRTLDGAPSLITDENGLSSHGIIHSILTRRLGLIVGCCMGIIVFIVLISVLGWLKLKKRRMENAKRQQMPGPPDYISYRHFSIPHDESATIREGGCNHQPAFISGAVLGTTTINC